MSRERWLTASGLLLILMLAAILTVQLSRDTGDEQSGASTLGTSGAASPVPTKADADVPDSTPVIAMNEIAEDALTRTMESVDVRSGSPPIVLSLPVMGEALNDLGLGAWTFEKGCQIPMQVVIIQGNFNVRPIQPASIPDEAKIPAKYIVYVYDVRIGEPIATFSDPNGALVKQALRDPSLPDPDASGMGRPTFPLPIPCDPTPVELPGASENDLSASPTSVP